MSLPQFVKFAYGEDDDGSSLAVAGEKLLVNRVVRLDSVIRELGGRDLFKKNKDIWTWDVFVDPKSGTPTLSASLSDVNTPYEIFIVKDGQDDTKLTHHGRALKARSFAFCTPFTCQSADTEVELDGLYLTPITKAGQAGTPSEALPTFVMIHGGPKDHNCDSFDTSPYK